MPRLLVIDRDKKFRIAASAAMATQGYEAFDASSAERGWARFNELHPEVVVLDSSLSELASAEGFARLRTAAPPIILLLADPPRSTPAASADLFRLSADDFITKPLQIPELVTRVANAVDRAALRKTASALEAEASRRFHAHFQVESGTALQAVVEAVHRVSAAPTTPIVIEGEAGTGREMFAELVHRSTPSRRGRAFVSFTCAGTGASEIERTLFDARQGLIALADGGTLFLDEVADLPPPAQGQLARLLGSGRFRPLGVEHPRRIDLRLIAGTSRPLLAEVERGRLRADLYQRLDVFRLRLPPLRTRRSDLMQQAHAFLRRAAAELHKPLDGFSTDAEAALLAYPFPRNVRELRNAVERAALIETSREISRDSLVLGHPQRTQLAASWASELMNRSEEELGRPPTLDDLERSYLERLLEQTQGNRSQVARLMGVSYPTVTKKIAAYQLQARGRGGGRTS